MNKYIALLLITIMLCLCSCKNTDITSSSVTNSTEQTEMSQTEATIHTLPDPTEEEDVSEELKAINPRLAYANYVDAEKVYTKSINAKEFENEFFDSLPVYEITSLEELEKFKKEFEDTFTMDTGYAEVQSFNDAIESCTDRFFRNKNILITYVGTRQGSDRPEFVEFVVSENDLLISIKNETPTDIGTDDMAGWFIIIDVGKTAIKDIESINAKLIE